MGDRGQWGGKKSHVSDLLMPSDRRQVNGTGW